VTVTDPKAVNNAWLRYPQLRFEASTSRALGGAELVLLLTEWDEYRRLSPAVAGRLVRRRVVLDGRNVLDAADWQAEGWVVRGLGTNSGGALETAEAPGFPGLATASGRRRRPA
jgi:UDPglucose 6-dehydrogenase